MGNGIVFDISRGSLHDGPGIRTTVFLKGCPLRCKWCHNPESQSFQPQLSYNDGKCMRCGTCAAVCPEEVHEFIGDKHKVDYSRCRLNGKCIHECPTGALSVIGKSIPAHEVMAEVLKDKKFYANSGGGLTVSGGEPTSQLDFLLELLSIAKHEGISTCIETCGYAKREAFEKVLPLADCFLYDYKLTDSKMHSEFTGVPNDLILSNLEYLHGAGAGIILRCPIIPGINDNEAHFRGIAEIMKRFPLIREVQLMAYNNWGNSKNRNIGCFDYFESFNPSEEDKNLWVRTIKGLGCEKVSIG